MSLREKIQRRRARVLGLRFALVSATYFILIVWMALVVLDSLSELGLLIFVQWFSWIGLSQQWIHYERECLISKDKETRITKTHLACAVITVILLWSLVASYLQSPLTITFLVLLVFNMLLYLSYASIGALPSNRFVYWLSVFVSVALFGWLLTMLTLGDALSPLSVEIVGAFLGVIAAIALGEVLKTLSSSRDVKDLEMLLLEELEDVEAYLESGGNDTIPIPIWSSAVAAGRILDLNGRMRQKLTRAYRDIGLFNIHRLPEYRDQALETIRNVAD